MLKKQYYEAPEAEEFLVKFEENILSDTLNGNEDFNNPQDYHGKDSWN